MKLNINIPFRWIVTVLIAVLLTSIVFLTCRNRKDAAVVLHPTQQEIDQVNKAKREHDLYVDLTNKKIALLQRIKDSALAAARVKDAELDAKSKKISALTRQAASARGVDETLFIESCDTLIPQVNDLLVAVDLLQQDNRNVQDAYDSLLSATSLKSARLEYDYSELKERFDRTSSTAKSAGVNAIKYKAKADKRFIVGPQVGVTYNIIDGVVVPYVGVGATWRLIRL